MSHKFDIVKDVAAASRLFKKVATGEMSLGEMFLGAPAGESAPQRGADEPPCTATFGCSLAESHSGQCVLNTTAEES